MRKNLFFGVLFVGVALLLSSCGGLDALLGNKQTYAGLASLEFAPVTDCVALMNDKALCYKIAIIDGKERQEIALDITRNLDGTFTVSYSAKDVRAFEGQELRAAVEIEMAKYTAQTLPKVVESMVKAILKSVKPL